MKRWEGWNAAIATMFTASSSGSLRRICAQFARLLSPRPEIQNRGMLSVYWPPVYCPDYISLFHIPLPNPVSLLLH
jgi:hypothetical protein